MSDLLTPIDHFTASSKKLVDCRDDFSVSDASRDDASKRINQSELVRRITAVLDDQLVDVDSRNDKIEDFAREIVRSCQAYQQWLMQLQDPEKWFGRTDILDWIIRARTDGDIDEALWRVFLATHFGRTSCEHTSNRPDSAARFLFGFGVEPMWTWQKVSTGLGGLGYWLDQHRAEAATLKFGNHRKHETNSDPEELFKVLESIVEWVKRNGGSPQSALSIEGASKPEVAFKILYRRLMGHPSPKQNGIYRFGRTACFDMLMLLGDLGLAAIRPGSCYLTGSTGPHEGAKVLWGSKYSDVVLEVRAETLAKRIEVPMNVIEDALCMWQKKKP
jgi:hypothetical protein